MAERIRVSSNFMRPRLTFTILLFFIFPFCFGQTRIPYDKQDSICKDAKKYDEPQRININFPAKKVSDKYKIKELHKAIPDSLNNEDNPKWWFYNYYFGKDLLDYNPQTDKFFRPSQNNLRYKLKDTHFFDINGDGLLDFIHYPKYYMAISRDRDAYELFIKQKDESYKWVTFHGFIIDIELDKDGSLNKMTTYQGPCCDDNQCTFYYYTFDKINEELSVTRTEQILTCQLIKKNKN